MTVCFRQREKKKSFSVANIIYKCVVGYKTLERWLIYINFEWMIIINTWIVCIRVIFNQIWKKKNNIFYANKNFYSSNSFHFFFFRTEQFCPIQDNCYDTFIRFFSHFISFLFLRPILRSARFFNSFSHSICILFFDYRKIINKIGIDSRIRRHNEMKLDILYVIFFKAYGMRFYKGKEEK